MRLFFFLSLLLLLHTVEVAAVATLATDLSNYYNNSTFKCCAAGHVIRLTYTNLHTCEYTLTHTHAPLESLVAGRRSEGTTEAPTKKFLYPVKIIIRFL